MCHGNSKCCLMCDKIIMSLMDVKIDKLQMEIALSGSPVCK